MKASGKGRSLLADKGFQLIRMASDRKPPPPSTVIAAYADNGLPRNWEEFAPLTNIKTGGTVKAFTPYKYQIEVVKEIERSQNTIIVKPRQTGMSESVVSYLLMRAVTEPGFAAVIFSKTQDDSSELGARIRNMALSLGSRCPKLTSESKTRLEFLGLGRLYFLPVTARSARGIPSVSVVLFDEAAFIDGIDGVYQAAVPTLSMLGDRGKVIFISTPNGKAGLYYKLLAGGSNEARRLLSEITEIAKPMPRDRLAIATDGDKIAKHMRIWRTDRWSKVLFHWRVHPVYGQDYDWAEKTRRDRQLTEAQWNQEYELDFAEGQTSVFNYEMVERATRGEWQRKRIYQHRYVAGVDPGFGGADYFTVRVWDVTSYPYRLANQYRANYKTHDYNISKAIAILQHFEPEQTNVETNGGGEIIFQELVGKLKNYKIEPCRTSNQSKIAQTDKLVLFLERDQIVFPAQQTKDIPSSEEYKHFVERVNGVSRYREAESGWHDDTVMADAIALSDVQSEPAFNVDKFLEVMG